MSCEGQAEQHQSQDELLDIESTKMKSGFNPPEFKVKEVVVMQSCSSHDSSFPTVHSRSWHGSLLIPLQQLQGTCYFRYVHVCARQCVCKQYVQESHLKISLDLGQ